MTFLLPSYKVALLFPTCTLRLFLGLTSSDNFQMTSLRVEREIKAIKFSCHSENLIRLEQGQRFAGQSTSFLSKRNSYQHASMGLRSPNWSCNVGALKLPVLGTSRLNVDVSQGSWLQRLSLFNSFVHYCFSNVGQFPLSSKLEHKAHQVGSM